MLKKVILNILKMTFAGGLIYWLVKSDKLDFSLLNDLIQNPLPILTAIGLMQIIILLITIRLKFFLHLRTKSNLSTLRIYMANWIGLFFNSVLPGSVSGDLVKIFYIKKEDKHLSKKFLLLSVFVDRVVGLMGLVFLGGLVSLFNYGSLSSLSQDVSNLSKINIFLMLIIAVSLATIYIAPNLPLKISSSLKKIPISILHKILNKLEIIWKDLILFKNKLIGQILISMVIQSISVFIFWSITSPYADNHFSLMTAFSIMPIGFISIALPIAPAGLGVGHVVFEKLLAFFQITNGASLFNLYFFVLMITNLTGVIPYLFFGTDKNIKFQEN